MVANNVLAHVADLTGLVQGIAMLLRPDGLAVCEMPYVGDLIANTEFDTIYHQHLCYFSVTALDGLFRQHGLHVNDVRRLAIHGGSLRIYVSRHDEPCRAVRDMLAEECGQGLGAPAGYRDLQASKSIVDKSCW